MKNSAAIASSFSDSDISCSIAAEDERTSSMHRGKGDLDSANLKGEVPGKSYQPEEPLYADDDGSWWPITVDEETDAGVIRVRNGLHESAEYLCKRLDMVMIGSGIDCDLVLADPQIARHHCLVVLGQGGYLVRALDATVEISGNVLNPGEQVEISAGETVSLAAVSIELLTGLAQKTKKVSSRKRVVWGSVFVATLTVIAGLWAGHLYLKMSAVVEDDVKAIESMPPPSAGIRVTEKSQHDLAGQVGEILRLSGIQAKTGDLGRGKVEVVGGFPDKEKLESVIHSRAMQDIKGLQQVIVRNQLEPKVTKAKLTDDKEISRVITGSDPYVVTRDDARYYPGAELANGKRIDQIKTDGVVVISTDGEKQLLELGALLY